MSYEPGETKPPRWATPFLGVGSSVFGAAVRLRQKAYDAGWINVFHADRPVISVGNLAVGGTGKTPFVILLTELLTEQDRKVAVLSRGYGGTVKDVLVVSRGEGPLVSAERAGDEPVLIAKRTKASVVVAPDRSRAAEVAVQELGADLLLLDDGFQHRRLARDLDIVLLDAHRPFSNGRLLPSGALREPKEALSRASLLVLNHGSVLATHPSWSELPQGIDRVEVQVVATGISEEDTLRNRKVALLCAIARPRRFTETVSRLGATVVCETHLRDHAELTEQAVRSFEERAERAGAEILLTTEKDAVRMPPDGVEKFRVLVVEHRIVAGRENLSRAVARFV